MELLVNGSVRPRTNKEGKNFIERAGMLISKVVGPKGERREIVIDHAVASFGGLLGENGEYVLFLQGRGPEAIELGAEFLADQTGERLVPIRVGSDGEPIVGLALEEALDREFPVDKPPQVFLTRTFKR